MQSKIITLLLGLLMLSITTFAQQISTLLNDPNREFAAMHWHEDGRIYAVDYFNGRLYQIGLDGSVETLLSGFGNMAGGGFDQAGNFYFSDINQGKIYLLNADNSYTLIGSGFSQPVGVLADPTDNDILLITEFETSKITKLSISSGAKSLFVSGNGINGPDAILYGWDEDYIVSNWNNHLIHKIDDDGNVSQLASIPATGFMGYVDRIGEYLYVPSFSARRLYRINREGEVTLIAGTGATGHIDGAGDQATFTRPNGTCHNPAGDTLLVSDDHTIRIITDFAPVVSSTQTLHLPTVSLSPNPVVEELQVTLGDDRASDYHWTIYDIQGRKIKDGKVMSNGGFNNAMRISTAGLLPGNYILGIGEQRFQFVKME